MNNKKGDIVLVKSVAGSAIPKIHVRLVERVIVKETKAKFNGFRWGMSWPAYSGWDAVAVYQKEIDDLRKNWSIPYGKVGEDVIFVYDEDIVSKDPKQTKRKRRRKTRGKLPKNNNK